MNRATEILFKKYPTASMLAEAEVMEVGDTLGGINYYRTKSKHIIKAAQIREMIMRVSLLET